MGEAALAVPLIGVRGDFLLNETAERTPQHIMFFFENRMLFAHGSSWSTAKAQERNAFLGGWGFSQIYTSEGFDVKQKRALGV
jgi:hypothetical protein